MNSSQSGSRKRAKTAGKSGTSSSTRRSSAYDAAFEQHLIDHGIYKNNHTQKPSNWADINRRLALSRSSLSPSLFTEAAFEAFQQTNEEALTENKVMSKAFPIIAGTADIPSQENLRFTNLKDLTDGSITKAQPDFYDGARPEELNKQIRTELGPYIVPSINTAAPCLPNFFTECKGPKGRADVNKLQACYDGTIGERAMNELLSYNDSKTAQYNTAHTITSTYHGGIGDLKLYCIHASLSNGLQHPVEYRMTQLDGWDMTGNPKTFRQGATALRNARDWAKEKRKELITAANGKILKADHSKPESSTQSFMSISSNQHTHPESKTSADELALDNNTSAVSIIKTPAQERTKPLPKVSINRQSKRNSRRRNTITTKTIQRRG